MASRTLPDLQQTLPGRSRPYRLFTVDHCDWEDFAPERVVVNDRWGVSYRHTYGRDGWVLSVYDVSGMPEEGIEYHALNGTEYDSKEEASRAAWEAGVLAFMIYEEN